MDWRKIEGNLKKADSHYIKGPCRPDGIPWDEVMQWIDAEPIHQYFSAERGIGFSDLLFKPYYFKPRDFGHSGFALDTWAKYVVMYGVQMLPGTYGPFYRYSPTGKPPNPTNRIGGYFTNINVNCYSCAISRLWLFDKQGNYIYSRKRSLYRHEAYFEIVDAAYAEIFVGKIAYGNAIQVRPNNAVLGWDNSLRRINGNRLLYKYPATKLTTRNCKRCRSFWSFYEKTIRVPQAV